MLKKILKVFTLALISVGIFLSVLNFLPEAKADAIYGTTTTITNPNDLWYWTVIYGPDEMSRRWLHEDLKYCLSVESNCCIVFAN